MSELPRKPPLEAKKSGILIDLLPGSLPKGRRSETLSDAHKESIRSEAILVRYRPRNIYTKYLHECREGHYHCEKTYCPICGRAFRRHTTGELLRLGARCKLILLQIRHSTGHIGSRTSLTVLYEGYILYPYRPSSIKNRLTRRLERNTPDRSIDFSLREV
jgi:hypothetical protein